MDEVARTILGTLAGGTVDTGRLPADLLAQRRTIAELALLWEADVEEEPPAQAFSAVWEDAGDGA
jgi:hypothetical protein